MPDDLKHEIEMLRQEVRQIRDVLQGSSDGERLGLVQKVNLVWRSYVWVLCTASAAVGAVATGLASLGVWLLFGMK